MESLQGEALLKEVCVTRGGTDSLQTCLTSSLIAAEDVSFLFQLPGLPWPLPATMVSCSSGIINQINFLLEDALTMVFYHRNGKVTTTVLKINNTLLLFAFYFLNRNDHNERIK